jgi:glycosyltransferase involved in cell wall biosynthesis
MECQISVMIFTLDEAENLPHCLQSLEWCDDVIVIDSGSSDNTVALSTRAGARIYSHPFAGFGSQRNWALDHAEPKYPWVLILDADERVPMELAGEMNRLVVEMPTIGAARVRRRFYMWGKWLRYSSLYPTWVIRLVHKDRVRYINRGHAETQQVEGSISALENDLIDQNHKGLDHWYIRQEKYAMDDAKYEIEQDARPLQWKELRSDDPLERKMALKRLSWKLPLRGLSYFIYSYFFRQGFRDGHEGFQFCRMRAGYQTMVVRNKRGLKSGRPTNNGHQKQQ